MMNTSLNLAALPMCDCELRFLHSSLLTPCDDYREQVSIEKATEMAENFSEYLAEGPKVSKRNGHYYVFDGMHTIEARKIRNGGKDLPILCKVYRGLSKEDEALLYTVHAAMANDLVTSNFLDPCLVEDVEMFLNATAQTGLTFSPEDGMQDWQISCIHATYRLYKCFGVSLYANALNIILDTWDGNAKSLTAGILDGVTYFIAIYQDEYDPELLIECLSLVKPDAILERARHIRAEYPIACMLPILDIYNGTGHVLEPPLKSVFHALKP